MKTRAFDRIKLVCYIGKSEYEICSVKFPFDWILEGKETLALRLLRGQLVVLDVNAETGKIKET